MLSRKLLIIGTILSIVTLNSGCNQTTTNTANNTNERERAATTTTEVSEQQVVKDFATNVVIPTYTLLVDKATNLNNAIQTFVSQPTADNLKAVQVAWRETRTPWEQSESFAFGPAASGYDGDLDDWPINQVDVSKVLKSNDKLSETYVDKNLQSTQKGFHTIEYLLFGENNNRQPEKLTARDLEFLKLLSTSFLNTAVELKTSWEKGIEGKPAYQETFSTAGNSNNTSYPTVKAALQEIIGGVIGCVEEVGEEKIGTPLAKKDSTYFESRFSHNSLLDFQNNIQGAINAYQGEFPLANTKGQSISNLVAKNNPELDLKVKSELQASLALLKAIPEPIETQLKNTEIVGKLKEAETKLLATYRMIQKEVQPMFQ
jgi:uncharacterized iron-regulated protein